MSVCKINGFEISSKARIDKKDISDYFQGQHILIQPFYGSLFMTHIIYESHIQKVILGQARDKRQNEQLPKSTVQTHF